MSAPTPRRSRQIGRIVDVGDVATFDRLVGDGARSLRGWRLVGIDLSRRSAALARLDPAGAVFAGCRFDDAAAADLRHRGALIFPELPGLPFDPYRSGLYTADELYMDHREGYEATPDAAIYAWSVVEHDGHGEMAIALHDAAIDDALDAVCDGEHVVGVMGGHAVRRGESAFGEATRLGRALRLAGSIVATGGGPGAMEAANLGSYLADQPEGAVADASRRLAAVASFRPSVGAWVELAFDVRDRWPGGDGGVGIPTWSYGHEPPNAFAGHVAKYFQNSVREDTLLRRCNGGIVFLPGAAGTVQEIFQDGCENYYGEPSTVAPMVLVGRDHWTSTVPAWPLLEALAAGRPMAAAIELVDSVDDAVEAIARHRAG